jgi:hypothetical protein
MIQDAVQYLVPEYPPLILLVTLGLDMDAAQAAVNHAIEPFVVTEQRCRVPYAVVNGPNANLVRDQEDSFGSLTAAVCDEYQQAQEYPSYRGNIRVKRRVVNGHGTYLYVY